jgi:hypothetical protein
MEGSGELSAPPYRSVEEFIEVLDRTFAMMSEDPDVGPKLREADVPQRYEFPDVGLVVNLRPGAKGEQNVSWVWSDEVAWEPQVRLTMGVDTANRYFQGKENVAIAIARRKIKAGGDVKAALVVIPLLKPVFEHYRRMVVAEYPHLEV